MKKRKKVFHAPGSPMALSLQSFKKGWDTNPESMELRRKRAVEKRSRDCKRARDTIYRYFVFEYSLNEITPEHLERICYQIKNRRRGQSKWSKIKSVRRYLTRYGYIKYDFERDLYLNCYKIDHEEKERAETDRRKAEDEQRRVEREAQQEAQRIRDEAQQEAHRETQPQPISQSGLTDLEGFKKMREFRLGLLSSIKSQMDSNPANPQEYEWIIERTKRVIEKLDLEISKLENCEAKL